MRSKLRLGILAVPALRYYAIYLAVALSLWVLFKPGSDGPLPFPQADKVIHATTFTFLAIAMIWRRISWRVVAIGLLIYAGVSEIIQHFWIPGREFELLDIAADSDGAWIGLAVGLRRSWL